MCVQLRWQFLCNKPWPRGIHPGYYFTKKKKMTGNGSSLLSTALYCGLLDNIHLLTVVEDNPVVGLRESFHWQLVAWSAKFLA